MVLAGKKRGTHFLLEKAGLNILVNREHSK